MEEPIGAQYAINIALCTLKDRCRKLQQRVTFLEEENVNLRLQFTADEEKRSISFTERDQLKTQITELSEQNRQLMNRVKMVTTENQDLWNKLSKLTTVNQNLGSQLNKINESLTKSKEPHSPLIRSKTFTQDEPHTKVLQRNLEENGRISSELEEISLKIINSLAQGKNEIDSFYSELPSENHNLHESDNIITESFGFYYDDFDNEILKDFNSIVDELKTTKEVVVRQKNMLEMAMNKINSLQEWKSTVLAKSEMIDKSTTTIPIEQTSPLSESIGPPVNNPKNNEPPISVDTSEMICPLCCRQFYETKFEVFQTHVEQHFVEDNFEVL